MRERKLDDAMIACDHVGKNAPTPVLQAKTNRLIERIRKDATRRD